MPTSHGIYRKRIADTNGRRHVGPEEVGVFRNGIRQVFEAITKTHVAGNPAKAMEAVRLEFHYRQITERFIFGLQQVNTLMQRMAALFNSGGISLEFHSIHLAAGCYADHILTYLNSMVDDIALAITHATGYSGSRSALPIDSMGKLKNLITQGKSGPPPALAPVGSLVTELVNAGSWWDLAFGHGKGIRQLIIHNHAFVQFQGRRKRVSRLRQLHA